MPFANSYGRRPVYLSCALLALATTLWSAYARSFPELVVARVLTGLSPAGVVLGAVTVADMFGMHQRCATFLLSLPSSGIEVLFAGSAVGRWASTR